MTDDTPLPFDLSAVRRKKLTVDFGGRNQSSNGGLLLLRSAERKLGICGRLAEAMPDRRDASRIRHAMFEMVMARVCAIACGHEDADAHPYSLRGPRLRRKRGASDRHGRSFWAGQSFHLGIKLLRERLDDTRA
jgi:hypothetical protein